MDRAERNADRVDGAATHDQTSKHGTTQPLTVRLNRETKCLTSAGADVLGREETLPVINVTLRDGETREISSDGAANVMEAIRDAGIDEMMALCGGTLSCATCHVHIAPDDWSRLSAMSGDENELLETSSHRTAYSRLSCQIGLSPELDGLSLAIAEDD